MIYRRVVKGKNSCKSTESMEYPLYSAENSTEMCSNLECERRVIGVLKGNENVEREMVVKKEDLTNLVVKEPLYL